MRGLRGGPGEGLPKEPGPVTLLKAGKKTPQDGREVLTTQGGGGSKNHAGEGVEERDEGISSCGVALVTVLQAKVEHRAPEFFPGREEDGGDVLSGGPVDGGEGDWVENDGALPKVKALRREEPRHGGFPGFCAQA